MAVLRLDHVQIAAPTGSEEAARRFYGDLLALREVAKPAALLARGGVWFQVGLHQLHVGIEEEFVPARKAHPAFAVDDLDELADRLKAAGVSVTWDAALSEVRRFYASDPFGNRLEFLMA
jgi:catechol 2,3-dioxygenase-like lactoylglutathione lyase family enzyme